MIAITFYDNSPILNGASVFPDQWDAWRRSVGDEPGDLIHPVLGRMRVSAVDEPIVEQSR